MIFIDANQYLLLYGITSGQKILDLLNDLRGVIFVTSQIVDEVQRNKVRKAKEYLRNQYAKINLPQVALPDHLLGISSDQLAQLRNEVASQNEQFSEQKSKILKISTRLLREISQSRDRVSKALEPLFLNAIRPTEPDLERARIRKERGNPPGKTKDALGDQISWEQLLTYSKEKPEIWIITDDSDYFEEFEGELLLNAKLYQELERSNLNYVPNVHCFNNMLNGLQHYIETCKFFTDNVPTPSEVAQLERELNSLNCSPLCHPYLHVSHLDDGKISRLTYKGGYWEDDNLRIRLFPKCQMMEVNGICHEWHFPKP